MEKPTTPEAYFALREEITEKNENFLGVVLRDEEKELDRRLKELIAACRSACGGSIPCDRPVLACPALWRTGLYDFCRQLPKGADLHVHGTSAMPVWKLIRFLSPRKDILIDPASFVLYLPKDAGPGCLPLGEALEKGVIDYTALTYAWTVLGAREEQDIWQYFENLFSFHAAMDEDMGILRDYYLTVFRDNVKNGIYHLELHVLFSEDRDTTRNIVATVRDAYYTVKKEAPFFSMRIIGAAMKILFCSMEETEAVFQSAICAQKELPDESDPDRPEPFVVGFDLINEEDASRSLREYAPMLLRLRQENPDFRFFLHCGESLNAHSDNLIDAYLLGAARVGHGMNLYRYPDLLRRYVKEEICLEICPVSNQTLRYTHDLRLHPGAEYLKRGVTLSLCSDDAVYQEHEQLTDDFFAAITAWELGIAEIKQLCINSIRYSALSPERKRSLLCRWHEEWKKFMKLQLADAHG